MAWEKGKSGNPHGRAKDKHWRDALLLAIGGDNRARLRTIAEKVITLAEQGDMQAIKEIGDRLDGKPAQTTVLQGDEDNPLHTVSRIERVIVDPANPDA